MHAGTGVFDPPSSTDGTGWISTASGMAGCERMEAWFSGQAYSPHRHDTYAIGRTLSGVQKFHYRGEVRAGLPETAMILHPDELHDGQAGTEAGFHYRMIYLDPVLIQEALGCGQPLPFIPGGISADQRLLMAIDNIVADMDCPMETLQYDDAIYDLAHALRLASPGMTQTISMPDYRAANIAREYMRDCPGQSVSMQQLEEISGRDRWKLSRDFRLLFGTSPYRYLIMRRLEKSRMLIRNGQSLVQTAIDTSFADQAHFSRHFRATYGITPARWRKLGGA